MTNRERYRLSLYQDLEFLDEKKKIQLKRNQQTGAVCVEKHIPFDCACVYRFLSEHPSAFTPEIYEYIPTREYIIVIEAYIKGPSLEDVLANRVLTPDEAISVILQLCEALRPLHQADPPIICRDLKAENIILDASGRPVIIDFDIARVYEPGKSRDTRLLGTREYAAPEQFGFRQTDARTDIYALGVLFNYMLLAKFPGEVMAPEPYAAIIRTCTQMDPEQRYRNTDELAKALCALRHTNPVHTAASAKTDKADAIDAIHKESFLPPGFRTRTPGKMLFSSVCYFLLVFLLFCTGFNSAAAGETQPPGWQRFEQLTVFISQLLFIAIACDYRGIRHAFPLVRSRNKAVRVLGCILVWLILIFAAAFLVVITEDLFL